MKYNITCHNASIDSLDIYVENEFQSIYKSSELFRDLMYDDKLNASLIFSFVV